MVSDPNPLTFLIADIRGYSTFTRERGEVRRLLLVIDRQSAVRNIRVTSAVPVPQDRFSPD